MPCPPLEAFAPPVPGVLEADGLELPGCVAEGDDDGLPCPWAGDPFGLLPGEACCLMLPEPPGWVLEGEALGPDADWCGVPVGGLD